MPWGEEHGASPEQKQLRAADALARAVVRYLGVPTSNARDDMDRKLAAFHILRHTTPTVRVYADKSTLSPAEELLHKMATEDYRGPMPNHVAAAKKYFDHIGA